MQRDILIAAFSSGALLVLSAVYGLLVVTGTAAPTLVLDGADPVVEQTVTGGVLAALGLWIGHFAISERPRRRAQ